MCWVYNRHLQTVGQISVGWLHPYFLKWCTASFKSRMESDPQTTSVWRPIHRQWKSSLCTTGTNGCWHRVSNLWSVSRNSPSLSLVCRKLLRIVALIISRQDVRQCQKCLWRTENLAVHLILFCCCPRTNYEKLWTSVINRMGYTEYGKWIHKSPSDQCKVIWGLAVSNNGVALDNMSLSFWICKLV